MNYARIFLAAVGSGNCLSLLLRGDDSDMLIGALLLPLFVGYGVKAFYSEKLKHFNNNEK